MLAQSVKWLALGFISRFMSLSLALVRSLLGILSASPLLMPACSLSLFSKQVNKLKRKRDHLTGYGPVSSLTSPSYPRSVVCPAQATLASPGSSEDTKHDPVPVLKKASDLVLSSPGIPFPRDHMVGAPTAHRSLPRCHPDTSLSEKEAFL